jgi:hypothetical protein
MVSDDFPEPDTPVTTTSLLRGIVTVIFFRLCTLAPLIRILSVEFTVAALEGFFPFIVFSIICTANVKP